MSDLLRIAVPNKGALSEAASSLLAEAGYRQRTDHKISPWSMRRTGWSSSI